MSFKRFITTSFSNQNIMKFKKTISFRPFDINNRIIYDKEPTIVFKDQKSLLNDTVLTSLEDGREELKIKMGRFTPGFDYENPHISSDIIQININNYSNKVDLYLNGKNPTFLRRKGELPNKIKNWEQLLGEQLEIRKPITLEDGDIVSFLGLNGTTSSIQFTIKEDEKELERKEEEEEDGNNNNNNNNNSNNNIYTDKRSNSIPSLSTTSISTTTSNTKKTKTSISNIDINKIQLKKHFEDPNSKNTGLSALIYYSNKPESFPDSVLYYDDKTVVVLDKYPKAKHHYLVIPRIEINTLDELTPSSIPMLEHMYDVANAIVNEIISKDNDHNNNLKKSDFKFGFHAIPSMKRLHLHIISNDYNSKYLKNNKHWNSFTTDFYIPFDNILNELKSNGKVKIDQIKYNSILSQKKECPICKLENKNLEILKDHYTNCLEKVKKI
ncbi:hypothetical protein ACTA71_002683 [Dictyostelium dimigraforme]